MITSDDPSKYPTLYHWRNAASHRSTIKQSLETLCNKLIKMSLGDKPNGQSVHLPNCHPSSAEPEAQCSSRCEPNTLSIRMPCGAGLSGYTPGKDELLIKATVQFVQHCLNYDGEYPANRILDADLQQKNTQKNGRSRKKDYQQKCHFLQRQNTQLLQWLSTLPLQRPTSKWNG